MRVCGSVLVSSRSLARRVMSPPVSRALITLFFCWGSRSDRFRRAGDADLPAEDLLVEGKKSPRRHQPDAERADPRASPLLPAANGEPNPRTGCYLFNNPIIIDS